MNKSTRQLLVLDYLPQFRCLCSACEDTCCAGWSIFFDRETLRLYDEQVKDDELLPLMHSALERRAGDDVPASAAAQLKLDPDNGRCPFLAASNLCRIQERLGENMLACTCARYPRQDSVVDGARERSLTLSCPEAARLVLLRREPLELRLMKREVRRWDYLFHRSVNTVDIPAIEGYKAYFKRIRTLVIRTLQQRELPFADRLLLVGLFCLQLERLIDGKNYSLIVHHLEAFEQLLAGSRDLTDVVAQVPPRTEVQLMILRALSAQHFQHGISHRGLSACAREFAEGLIGDTHTTEKEYLDRYKHALHQYYLPFIQNHEHILENWCVNDVFRTLFPFDATGSVFEQYALLALKVALVKFYLVGVGAYHGGLNQQICVRVIQSFCRGFEASKTFQDSVFGLLESQGLKNLPTMAMLLKD